MDEDDISDKSLIMCPGYNCQVDNTSFFSSLFEPHIFISRQVVCCLTAWRRWRHAHCALRTVHIANYALCTGVNWVQLSGGLKIYDASQQFDGRKYMIMIYYHHTMMLLNSMEACTLCNVHRCQLGANLLWLENI